MILVKNDSGIGNRFKNIVSALRLGDRLGCDVKLDRDYSNLFSITRGPIYPSLPQLSYTTWRLEGFGAKNESPLKVPNCTVVLTSERVVDVYRGSIDLQFSNIKDHIQREVLKYFNMIKFTPYVEDCVARLSEAYPFEHSIGVQIRSWRDSHARSKILFDLNDFESVMRDYPVDTSFFLSSDSESVIRYFSASFPGRVFYTQGSGKFPPIRGHQSEVAYASAIVDLLLLSKCPTLIGSYQSTFSEVAWWLSNCSQEVVIKSPKRLAELMSTNIQINHFDSWSYSVSR